MRRAAWLGCLAGMASVALAQGDGAAFSVTLGATNEEQGLRQRDHGDGTTIVAERQGRLCRGTNLGAADNLDYYRFIYFNVDDRRWPKQGAGAAITVEYLGGGRWLRLEYDPGPGGEVFKRLQLARERERQWAEATFYVPDAGFTNRCNGDDFRLSADGDLYVASVTVKLVTPEEAERGRAEQEAVARAIRAARQKREQRAWQELLRGADPTDRAFGAVTLFTGPLLSSSGGPWDGGEAAPTEAFSSWRRRIDWAAANGIDRLIAGGIVSSGWEGDRPDYSFVVDWAQTDFPEAAVIDAGEVKLYISRANEILAYAKERGVGIYLHNYHFTAPRALLEKHPEITCKWEPGGGWVGNVNWDSDVYQEFLRTAWREQFRNLPDLPGRCDTCGEMVFGCENQTTATAGFARAYAEEHRQAGRRPLMRNWWMHRCHTWIEPGIESILAPEIHYIMKFSHTDAVTHGPDAELRDWVRAGRSMSSHVAYPGENARDFVWCYPQFVFDNMAAMKESGVGGATGSIGGAEPGVERANALAFVAYATGKLPLEGFEQGRWERFFGELLGTADGRAVLRGTALYSEALLSISRVVGHPCEGFDCRHTHYLPPRKWMSTLGFQNASPPAEWREGQLSFQEIIDWLQTRDAAWEPRLDRRLAGDRVSCFDFLEQRAAEAREGWELLRSVRAEDEEQLQVLRDNAEAVWHYLTYWERLLWSRLKFEAILRQAPGDLTALAAECVSDFEAALPDLQRTCELCPGEGPKAELARRREELKQLGERLAQAEEEIAAVRAWRDRGGWRVQAEWLDLDQDDPESGYQADLNTTLIRIGPAGAFPYRPHAEGVAVYRFAGEAGQYEIRVRYMDDKDDPADSEARIRVLVNEEPVHEWALNRNDDEYHVEAFTADLPAEAVVKFAGRCDRTGNDFCRLDEVWFVPAEE